VFRDGGFADGQHLFVAHPFVREGECYAMGSGQRVDCAALQPQRVRAVERLAVSDTILQHDMVPALVTSKPRLTLSDVPPPQPYSPEFGIGNVQLEGPGIWGHPPGFMLAHPPSGATFTVQSNGSAVRVLFTPDFNPDTPADKTDGVTFEIWSGGERLYQRLVKPTDLLGPSVVDVPSSPGGVQIAFVTTPGPHGNSYFDWALWRNVQFFVGNDLPPRSLLNTATRDSLWRIFELAPPTAFSPQLGVEYVKVVGTDLNAAPPSGATFVVPTHHRPLEIVFTPSIGTAAGNGPKPVIPFEVWAGGARVYEGRLDENVPESPVSVRIRGAALLDEVRVSFVLPGGREDRFSRSRMTWRDVKFIVGCQGSVCP
jgi:hypothetical protein